MEGLKEFLTAIMTVSVCAGLVQLLAPEGKGGGLKKQIGFVVSAAVCAALISPVLRSVGEGAPFDFGFEVSGSGSPESPEEALLLRTRHLLRGEIEYMMTTRFGIGRAEAEPELEAAGDSEVRLLSVTLSGEGALEEAAEYVGKTFGCPVRLKDREEVVG